MQKSALHGHNAMHLSLRLVCYRNDILLAVDKDVAQQLTEVLCEGVPDCKETLSKVILVAERRCLYIIRLNIPVSLRSSGIYKLSKA